MARLTRKELKKDPFLSIYYDDFIEFVRKHYQRIILAVMVVILAVVASAYWRRYEQAQEVNANTLLGAALDTFDAYVGPASSETLGPNTKSFPTPTEKYQAALKAFTAVVDKYPHQRAADIARYHIGLCQAELGQEQAAINTLEQAARVSDRNLASLAEFALAGELARTGKLPQAEEIYRRLAEHPTVTVPAATAWLALASAYRTTQPAQARAIYERIEKEYGSDTYLASVVKQELASLPH